MLVIHNVYPLEVPDSLEQDIAARKEDQAAGRFLEHGAHLGAF
jgi:hypothetical protein